MGLYFKIDVAIAFPEQNLDVAQQIVDALKQRKIRYYFYKEHIPDSWGQHLLAHTLKFYGWRTRYVLLITSEHFGQAYWSNIEKQVAQIITRQKGRNILQLKIDAAVVAGIPPEVVHCNWDGDADMIADYIVKKVIRHKRRVSSYVWMTSTIIVSAIIAIICIFYSKSCIQKIGIINSNPEPVYLPSTKLPDSFYISKTEVTIDQYQKFCKTESKLLPPQHPNAKINSPVVNVSWADAVAYCKWVKGRLPTVQEWETAAGKAYYVKYSGGNNAQKVAVYNRTKPGAVGTRDPNLYGLHDMTGNVAEWCADASDTSQQRKAVKGGAFNSSLRQLIISEQDQERKDSFRNNLGFRVAWDKISHF